MRITKKIFVISILILCCGFNIVPVKEIVINNSDSFIDYPEYKIYYDNLENEQKLFCNNYILVYDYNKLLILVIIFLGILVWFK